MAGIQVDHGWIANYASTAEQAGDELAAALRTLQGSPLTSAAFGDVGRTVGSAEAYQNAATTLQQQLDRAAAALHTAATNLRTVAAEHSSVDEQQAAAIRSTHQI
jgi:predicted nucleic acid-binding protein